MNINLNYSAFIKTFAVFCAAIAYAIIADDNQRARQAAAGITIDEKSIPACNVPAIAPDYVEAMQLCRKEVNQRKTELAKLSIPNNNQNYVFETREICLERAATSSLPDLRARKEMACALRPTQAERDHENAVWREKETQRQQTRKSPFPINKTYREACIEEVRNVIDADRKEIKQEICEDLPNTLVEVIGQKQQPK